MKKENLTKSQSQQIGTKAEGSVGLGNENSICMEAQEFISEYYNYVDNYTLFIMRDSFRGFTEDIQKHMVQILQYVFNVVDIENAVLVFPSTGIQHVDLLLSDLIYKINVSMDKFAYYER